MRMNLSCIDNEDYLRRKRFGDIESSISNLDEEVEVIRSCKCDEDFWFSAGISTNIVLYNLVPKNTSIEKSMESLWENLPTRDRFRGGFINSNIPLKGFIEYKRKAEEIIEYRQDEKGIFFEVGVRKVKGDYSFNIFISLYEKEEEAEGGEEPLLLKRQGKFIEEFRSFTPID